MRPTLSGGKRAAAPHYPPLAPTQVRGPFLVLAPLSTLGHWKREFDDWTDMNALYYHDAVRGRQARGAGRKVGAPLLPPPPTAGRRAGRPRNHPRERVVLPRDARPQLRRRGHLQVQRPHHVLPVPHLGLGPLLGHQVALHRRGRSARAQELRVAAAASAARHALRLTAAAHGHAAAERRRGEGGEMGFFLMCLLMPRPFPPSLPAGALLPPRPRPPGQVRAHA